MSLDPKDVVLDHAIPDFHVQNNMTRSLEGVTEAGEKAETRSRSTVRP